MWVCARASRGQDDTSLPQAVGKPKILAQMETKVKQKESGLFCSHIHTPEVPWRRDGVALWAEFLVSLLKEKDKQRVRRWSKCYANKGTLGGQASIFLVYNTTYKVWGCVILIHEFSSAIIRVFSDTWSFWNHSNTSRNIYYYHHQCWKLLCGLIFLWKPLFFSGLLLF